MATKLEIFKPGTHTAMNGATLEFSAADLAATVAAYDPAKGEAPLVVGHPRTDAPAYGWVKRLEFADGVLVAEPDQVDPDFSEMVNAGRFKRISASFYMPTAPGNPCPGVYYLRHVGFLGAQPPAVKGLKAASFSAFEEGVVNFGMDDRVTLSFFRRIKNWIIGKDGQDQADAIFPEYDLEMLQAEITRDAIAEAGTGNEGLVPAFASHQSPVPAFNQEEHTMKETELTAQKAELDRQAAEFAQREQALAAREAELKHAEHVSFCDGLVSGGKLLPAQKEQVVALLDFAAGIPAETVIEFADGGGCKKKGPAEALRDFLSAQPKIVEFGEVTRADQSATGSAGDRLSAAINRKLSANNNLTYSAAFVEVQQENPELAADYVAEMKEA